MRPSIPFILILATQLALHGCRSIDRAMAELPDEAPQAEVGPRVDLRERSAPFEITFADVINDLLMVQVTYNGGCEDHSFHLLSNGKYTATYPPEIVLHIRHDDHGDRCRGVVDEKRYFDLTNLRYPGTNRVRLVFHKTNKILDYIY